MERVNRILQHPTFRRELEALTELEQGRPFCRHGIEHLMDVARLAYLYNLEEGHGLSERLIYAAALLHDIGRGEQYRTGIPHDQAGLVLAADILKECGFSKGDQAVILDAIARHRQADSSDSALGALLYRADKKSRPCFACPAQPQCNWPLEKQNLKLER